MVLGTYSFSDFLRPKASIWSSLVGCLVPLWAFFLGLSGNDMVLAYFGEKENVSDLFQITLVCKYGLGW